MSDGADETGIGELPLDDAAFEPGGDGRESGDDPGGRRDLVSGGRGSVGDSCPTSESMTIDLGSGISMHLVEISQVDS
jgi:hypothetical protein